MKITSAESAVMEVLWSSGPTDAEEVTARLAESQAWTETTVRTLLARLVQKKAVEKAKEGRRYLFRPLIERADYVHAESKSLIDRLFEGRLGPLFAQFSEREELSDEDIAELKALIARIEDGR
jgi:BlaI family transcriptional regulator, penicillinase repressor